jgi:hypothetical protein
LQVKKETLHDRWQSITAFTTVTLWTILLGQIKSVSRFCCCYLKLYNAQPLKCCCMYIWNSNRANYGAYHMHDLYLAIHNSFQS